MNIRIINLKKRPKTTAYISKMFQILCFEFIDVKHTDKVDTLEKKKNYMKLYDEKKAKR